MERYKQRRTLCSIVTLASLFFINNDLLAENKFGTLLNDKSTTPGYTLFAPYRGTSAYLINNDGELINRWDEPDGFSAGAATLLTRKGDLVRALLVGNKTFGAGGGIGGKIRGYDWENNLLWDFTYKSPRRIAHHTIKEMPNGNILFSAYERKTRDECLDLGLASAVCNECPIKQDTLDDEADGICEGKAYDPNLISWNVEKRNWEHLVEIKPYPHNEKHDDPKAKPGSARVVWKWHLWDHLLLADQKLTENPEHWNPGIERSDGAKDNPDNPDGRHPSRFVDANFNHIDYYKKFNQILLSCNSCNEIFVIERGKNTRSSRKHYGGEYEKGGDLLYRWGNSANFGLPGAIRTLGNQHGARWLDRDKREFGYPLRRRDGINVGNILLFNNAYSGTLDDLPSDAMNYSAVFEIDPPMWDSGFYRYYGDEIPEDPDSFTMILDEIQVGDTTKRFQAGFMSSVQRFPNNNTLLTVGADFDPDTETGVIYEVEPTMKMLAEATWKFVSPVYSYNQGPVRGGGKLPDFCVPLDGKAPPPRPRIDKNGDPVIGPDGQPAVDVATNWIFRAYRYANNFAGFSDKKLYPKGTDLCQDLDY